jgi:prevent-host-death family protein
MKTLKKVIGSNEAKTHLSTLLNDIQKGDEVIITKRGKPVAKLIPYKNEQSDIKIEEIILQFDTIRNSVKKIVNIKEYITEGRKY